MAKTILVVDDSSTVRQQVSLALKQAGFGVVEAVDGQDALDKLAGSSYDLMISDVNMPRMNGLDMIEALKTKGTHPTMPIVLLTTEGQPALIKRAKAAGAKGWIVKPFKAAMLVAAAKKLTGS